MKITKVERQRLLRSTIEASPFITDEELAKKFSVSIQTIRLDRMALSIPELRKRIKTVAKTQWNETVKSLTLVDVIGEIIDLELDQRAISMLIIKPEHVFSRNKITRGHHLFAQANSLAVAVINDELSLTSKSEIKFKIQVKQTDRDIETGKVVGKHDNEFTGVQVNSFVVQVIFSTGTS